MLASIIASPDNLIQAVAQLPPSVIIGDNADEDVDGDADAFRRYSSDKYEDLNADVTTDNADIKREYILFLRPAPEPAKNRPDQHQQKISRPAPAGNFPAGRWSSLSSLVTMRMLVF